MQTRVHRKKINKRLCGLTLHARVIAKLRILFSDVLPPESWRLGEFAVAGNVTLCGGAINAESLDGLTTRLLVSSLVALLM